MRYLDYSRGQTYTSQFTVAKQGKIFIYPTDIGQPYYYDGSNAYGSSPSPTVSINSTTVYKGITTGAIGWSNAFGASAKADGASSCAEFLVDINDVIAMSYAKVVFVPFKTTT